MEIQSHRLERHNFRVKQLLLEAIVTLVVGTIALGFAAGIAFMLVTHNPKTNRHMKKWGKIDNIARCTDEACLAKSVTLFSEINAYADPCDNFYEFSCQNVFQSEKNESFNDLVATISNQEKSKMHELYKQPIVSEDHALIQLQKKIYTGCMAEKALFDESFLKIHEIMSNLGGWPAVEGEDWHGEKFDWLEATYMLRDMGYFHAFFLELNVVPDPDDENKYIFQVSVPEMPTSAFTLVESTILMMEITDMFGTDFLEAVPELAKGFQFYDEIRSLRHEELNVKYYKTTVAEYQQKEPRINWLEFINRISTQFNTSKTDFVMFPVETELKILLDTILNKTNRIVANYMISKTIQDELVPYLITGINNEPFTSQIKDKVSPYSTRSEFCIHEVEKRFLPNPMEIIYMRKYLPEYNRNYVYHIVNSMKEQLEIIVRQFPWMVEKDRKIAGEMINKMKIVVGAPGNYFDAGLLDTIDYLHFVDGESYFNLLWLANTNQNYLKYSKINRFKNETTMEWKEMFLNLPQYDSDKNEIYIPAYFIQPPMFSRQRPNYLNFPNIAMLIKDALLQAIKQSFEWSHKTIDSYEIRKICMMQDTNIKVIEMLDDQVEDLFGYILSVNVSYASYKKWEIHNQELLLPDIKYTPDQLFWITSGNIYCQYLSTFPADYLKNNLPKALSMLADVIKNVHVFDDFNCPYFFNDGMANKCEIL